jgi:biopolymer transport protein ExbD
MRAGDSVRGRNPFAKARAKRREMPTVELSLAAMVDMMINILIFLLFLYGKGSLDTPPSEDLQLAKSDASEQVRASVGVVVTRKAVEVGGKSVLDLVDDGGVPRLPEGAVQDGRVPELTAALSARLAKVEAKPLPAGQKYQPELLVETDRRVPWSVLGPVLRSGAEAGLEQYRFVVAIQKPQGE